MRIFVPLRGLCFLRSWGVFMKSNNNLEKIKVLIVDDEKLIQRLVYDVLTRLGFRLITVANSGRQAMDLVAKLEFDFIITDWQMKNLNGIDLIRYVRSSPHTKNGRIPFIMLTGNSEVRDVVEARDAGVNEYIIKPFSSEQLVRRIRSIIERPKSYVVSPNYIGPNRRHKNEPPPHGIERRKRTK